MTRWRGSALLRAVRAVTAASREGRRLGSWWSLLRCCPVSSGVAGLLGLADLSGRRPCRRDERHVIPRERSVIGVLGADRGEPAQRVLGPRCGGGPRGGPPRGRKSHAPVEPVSRGQFQGPFGEIVEGGIAGPASVSGEVRRAGRVSLCREDPWREVTGRRSRWHFAQEASGGMTSGVKGRSGAPGSVVRFRTEGAGETTCGRLSDPGGWTSNRNGNFSLTLLLVDRFSGT